MSPSLTAKLGHVDTQGSGRFGGLFHSELGEPTEEPDSFTCHSETYLSGTLNPEHDPLVTEISLLFDSISDMPGFCPLEPSGEVFFSNTNVKDLTPDIQIQVLGGD